MVAVVPRPAGLLMVIPPPSSPSRRAMPLSPLPLESAPPAPLSATSRTRCSAVGVPWTLSVAPGACLDALAISSQMAKYATRPCSAWCTDPGAAEGGSCASRRARGRTRCTRRGPPTTTPRRRTPSPPAPTGSGRFLRCAPMRRMRASSCPHSARHRRLRNWRQHHAGEATPVPRTRQVESIRRRHSCQHSR